MGAYFSSVPKTETKIPGHVAIVTGGNRGLGLETAKQLYELGATIYIGSRTEESANQAIARIRADVPNSEGQLKWLLLDLSSIKQAREAAREFLKLENRLDILVNNSAKNVDHFGLNEDGYESQFAVNHIGHFVFTRTLLDLMKQTSAQAGSDVRIVVLSSQAHDTTFKTPVSFSDPSDLKKVYPENNDDSWTAMMSRYGRSKVANILFASELQRQLDAENHPIIVISLHPGAVDTDGAHDVVSRIPILGYLSGLIIKYAFLTREEGARNSVFAAANPVVRAEPEKYKGKYLTPVGKITAPSGLAQDSELAKRLWSLTETIVESHGSM